MISLVMKSIPHQRQQIKLYTEIDGLSRKCYTWNIIPWNKEDPLMRIVRQTLARLGIIGEIFVFLWRRKLWWLIPMVTVLILFGLLLFFAQASAVAPFIYTLF
jgi:hypothetical protein